MTSTSHDGFAFNEATDLSVVAWLAQYDPGELPPELSQVSLRLVHMMCTFCGPCLSQHLSRKGIPPRPDTDVAWHHDAHRLANLSTEFKRAYETADDPHDELGPTRGGRLNRETGKRTFPREFGRDEQARFDRLQDEYHNLRWRNLLNLGYDAATAATMVGAVRDAESNFFSPPPLFALSPRMIVTDEGKRKSMRRVLIDYLDRGARAAEQSLLEDLEREEQDDATNAEGRKMTKNAKKRAKKKAKKQAQKQEPKDAERQQGPLNQEQLKYLREHQQQQRERAEATGEKRAYTEEDRRIIEEALKRNGLTESAAMSPETAERIYKASASGKAKAMEGDDGDGDVEETEGEETKEDEAKPGYEKEVQNYAYAWCCDYCKKATFPTFAEAALHESKCPAFLEQKAAEQKNDKEVEVESNDAAGVDGGEKEEGKDEEEEEEDDEEDESSESSEESEDEIDYGQIIKGRGGAKRESNNRGLLDKNNAVNAIHFVREDKGGSSVEEAEPAVDGDKSNQKSNYVGKKQTPSNGASHKKSEKIAAATKNDAAQSLQKTGRKDEDASKAQNQRFATKSVKSSTNNASSAKEGVDPKGKTPKSKQKKGNKQSRVDSKQWAEAVGNAQKENASRNNDTVTDSTQSSSAFRAIAPDPSSLSDQELAQLIRPLNIVYDDRVNDTALPPPTRTAETSLVPLSTQPLESPPMIRPIPRRSPDLTAQQLSSLASENEILTARCSFLEQQNKSLLLANEALQHELAAVKQKSVEAVQQVQLKAYVAETARDAAAERAAWLENMLADAATEMATKEIVEQEVQEAVMRAAAVGSMRQQQNHMARPLPQASSPLPLPQSLPPGYHQRQLPPSPLSALPPTSPMSNNMMASASPPGGNGNLLRSPAPQSQLYNQNNHRNGSETLPNPLGSLSGDFWEPPWRSPQGDKGTMSDSVLSRLRRGDHA